MLTLFLNTEFAKIMSADNLVKLFITAYILTQAILMIQILR